jgi:SAM-dependent methyltransferase
MIRPCEVWATERSYTGSSALSLRDVYIQTLRPVYVVIRDRLGYNLIDRPRGLRTAAEVDLGELGLAGENRQRYRPSGWLHLRRVLPKREITEDDVFIDLGSGMGRVVFQAARYPFKRVIGVELSDELNEIARANIERNRHRLRCKQIELVTSDVLDYDLPDDVTVAYLYNPFTGDVFADVIDRLIRSVDRHPRPLRIIYTNPVEHQTIMGTGRLRQTKVVHARRPSREWARFNATRIYTVITPAEPSAAPERKVVPT